MEHWIEVLFGGVGGTILLAAFGWGIKWLVTARSKRETAASVATSPSQLGSAATAAAPPLVIQNREGLLPKAIQKAIRAASPFARPTISETFEGSEVEWNLWLQQVLVPLGAKEVVLRMSESSTGIYPQIMCRVGVDKFPFLKFVHEGSTIHVCGRIAKVSELQIELTNVVLTLIDANLAGELE